MKTLTDAFTITHLAWYRISPEALKDISRKNFQKTSTAILTSTLQKLEILILAIKNEIKMRENQISDLEGLSFCKSDRNKIITAINTGNAASAKTS